VRRNQVKSKVSMLTLLIVDGGSLRCLVVETKEISLLSSSPLSVTVILRSRDRSLSLHSFLLDDFRCYISLLS
jgi:hypothetical protein